MHPVSRQQNITHPQKQRTGALVGEKSTPTNAAASPPWIGRTERAHRGVGGRFILFTDRRPSKPKKGRSLDSKQSASTHDMIQTTGHNQSKPTPTIRAPQTRIPDLVPPPGRPRPERRREDSLPLPFPPNPFPGEVGAGFDAEAGIHRLQLSLGGGKAGGDSGGI